MQSKKGEDSVPDPFVNVKSEEIESSDPVDPNRICPKCGKNFSSSRSLKRHMKSLHVDHENKTNAEPQVEEESVMTCKECNVVFTRDEYQKHKLTHKNSFECDVCSKV